MASSGESRKKIVLKKYRTELRSTLSQCIEDVLPDLESSGAIGADQRDKVREYVKGKMPANAVDYLIDDHMTKPLTDEGFTKLLGVMKKAPKCSPHCKALATTMEEDFVNGLSSIVDEITKAIERLGNEKDKLQEAIKARTRRWENCGELQTIKLTISLMLEGVGTHICCSQNLDRNFFIAAYYIALI